MIRLITSSVSTPLLIRKQSPFFVMSFRSLFGSM